MTFKEFIDKYLGLIIGVLVALIMIMLKAVYVVECIVFIFALGWFGKYVQSNRDTVKDKLKDWIDRF